MGTPPPLPEVPRGLRLEERAPSITTLMVDGVKMVATGSGGPVCSTDVLTTVQVEAPAPPLSRFGGFPADAPQGILRQSDTPYSHVAAPLQHRLEQLLPEVVQRVLPNLVPALLPAAVAAATPALSALRGVPGLDAGAPGIHPSGTSAVLESALAPVLGAILPKAVSATLSVLFKALNSDGRLHVHGPGHLQTHHHHLQDGDSLKKLAAGVSAGSSADHPSAAVPQAEQHLLQQQQQLQLVRMLFGTEAAEAGLKPAALEIVEASGHANCGVNNTPSHRSVDAAAAAAGPVVLNRVDSPKDSAISSAVADSHLVLAATNDIRAVHLEHTSAPTATAEAVPVASPRRPSLAAFQSSGEGNLESSSTDMAFSRRLSDTNFSTFSTAATINAANAGAAVAAAAGSKHPPPPGQPSSQRAFSCSSGGSGGVTVPGELPSQPLSWAPGEDASSGDEALSTCSGVDIQSPYVDLCRGGSATASAGHAGPGDANSSGNSFLMCGSSVDNGAVDPAGAAAGIYGISREALLERLQQQVQTQRVASPFSSPAELLLAAAGGASGSRTAAPSSLASQLAAAQNSVAASSAATAAALYMQQQQQQAQQAQQQQAQQQLQQLQQLQALVSGTSVGSIDCDLASPASPTLGSSAGGLQWRRSSGTNGVFAASDLWEADALGFAAAASLAQQQQQAVTAAGLIQQQAQQAQQAQQQQQLLAQSLAAVAAAGRSLRPEDLIAFGGTGGAGAGLQLPSAAAASAALGGQAAAQLAAVAAAAAGVPSGVGATDLAPYVDAALRRMLLVSPQVASELARACGAFSGAQTQIHHLCCVISEQLLDVAAMAAEVAAALLRALAVHRARGAQATDVDPRVMGRILQLLRAGPAGRQLCLVSLEQWVDGLSRIHKRRAYLDTILHNYQLTLKRLVQAMGHQVHAVNMSLPRQLLNDLSPRALLLLTAELTPYPLLQPRRWSEEIIWSIMHMHSMGIDMTLNNPAANSAAAAGQAPASAFQWEIRRALAVTAEDISAAGGAAVACGQSPPSVGAAAGPLAGLSAPGSGSGASGSTTPGGTAVPWAAHAALHRHLLLGLRRIQSRFFSERLRNVHGLYGEAVEALLRSSLPQDVLVPEREMVVLVSVLLMLECRMRPEDFDAAFGRDLQRCLAVSSAEEVAARLRCGLVADSQLRIDPHKSRALSQLLKLGTLPGQSQF